MVSLQPAVAAVVCSTRSSVDSRCSDPHTSTPQLSLLSSTPTQLWPKWDFTSTSQHKVSEKFHEIDGAENRF